VKEVEVDEGTLATDLTTLIYGKPNSKLKKIGSSRDLDSFRLKTRPRHADIEGFTDTIKSLFLVGADFAEDMSDADNAEDSDVAEEAMEVEEELNVDSGGNKLGRYIRIELEGIGEESYLRFTPEVPVILCAVKSMENTLGYLKTRVKKHRW
jgi:hypothetical protein